MTYYFHSYRATSVAKNTVVWIEVTRAGATVTDHSTTDRMYTKGGKYKRGILKFPCLRLFSQVQIGQYGTVSCDITVAQIVKQPAALSYQP